MAAAAVVVATVIAAATAIVAATATAAAAGAGKRRFVARAGRTSRPRLFADTGLAAFAGFEPSEYRFIARLSVVFSALEMRCPYVLLRRPGYGAIFPQPAVRRSKPAEWSE